MDERALVRGLAVTRVAAGGVLLLVPSRAAGWLGPVARRPEAAPLARSLGMRDLLLGWRTLRALASGAPLSTLLRYGMAADAADLVATLLAFGHLPRRGRLAVVAASGSAVALGWRLSRSLD